MCVSVWDDLNAMKCLLECLWTDLAIDLFLDNWIILVWEVSMAGTD